MFLIKLSFLKLIDFIARSMGRGSSRAGFIAGKINFDLARHVNFDQYKVIYVIGTNGKTTSANLITDMFSLNHKVITNREGANLLAGIVTTMIRNLKFNKTFDAEYLIFEVDEKTVKHIVKIIKPNDVVITNFFRDQLDRYGEIDTIIKDIISNINDENINIHLNGCDPLMLDRFKDNVNTYTYYGLDKTTKSIQKQDKIVEIKYCPDCLKPLAYEYYHYGHIGNFKCDCGFMMPELNLALAVDFNDNKLIVDDQTIEFMTNTYPVYFYFNIASSLSVVKKYSDSYISDITTVLSTLELPKGRSQLRQINDHQVYLNLVKNVVGFEETIDYVVDNFKETDLLILFNDNPADGRDVSWIWDTHITSLNECVKNIYIGGIRRYDMAMRFEFDGFDNVTVIDGDEYDVTKQVLSNNQRNLAIISNYTPLVKVARAISDMEEKWF